MAAPAALPDELCGEIIRWLSVCPLRCALSSVLLVSKGFQAMTLERAEKIDVLLPHAAAVSSFIERFSADGAPGCPPYMPGIRVLSVDCAQDCEEDCVATLTWLPRVCHLDRLRELYIGLRVCDIGVLGSCTALVTLHLGLTDVADISALAGCTKLQELDLSATRVTDIGPLRACAALEKLDLCDTGVEDLSPLTACPALRMLNLRAYGTYESRVRKDIGPLGECAALQMLDLAHSGVADVAPLGRCRALVNLDLCFTSVVNVAALGDCTALSVLCLVGTDVTDVAALAGCAALETLCLNDTLVVDVSMLRNFDGRHEEVCHTGCTCSVDMSNAGVTKWHM
jgi:hypothetical protein